MLHQGPGRNPDLDAIALALRLVRPISNRGISHLPKPGQSHL